MPLLSCERMPFNTLSKKRRGGNLEAVMIYSNFWLFVLGGPSHRFIFLELLFWCVSKTHGSPQHYSHRTRIKWNIPLPFPPFLASLPSNSDKIPKELQKAATNYLLLLLIPYSFTVKKMSMSLPLNQQKLTQRCLSVVQNPLTSTEMDGLFRQYITVHFIIYIIATYSSTLCNKTVK